MRSQLLNTLAGTLGLTALAASSPSPQNYDDPDACVLSVSTVFVTISQAAHTITLQQAPTSTVYVTLSASSAVEIGKIPTGTETRVNSLHRTTTLTPQPETVYITIPGSSQTEGGAAASSSPYYETTVTHYTRVTVTEVLTGPITSTTTAVGPLSFTIDNGTTSWLNGQAPDSTVSLVVVASVVTVVPLITPSTVTSTTTLKTTIFETHPVTLTENLSTKNTSIGFPGMASGGWNATSNVAGIASPTYDPSVRVGSTATGFETYFIDPSPTISQISIVTSQSIDIYDPHTALSLTFLSAESGFTALPPQSAPTSTLSVSTQVTASAAPSTTVISSTPTLVSPTSSTLGVSSPVSSSSLSLSSSLPPYSNSTSTASASSISPALGVSTSVSTSLSSSYSPQPSSSPCMSCSGSLVSTYSSASVASPTFPSPPPYASPTACGEVGDFALNFDDIPPLSVPANESASDVSPLPIFNPYHQFEFSDGFTVGPPPTEPYIPSSLPLLVEFIPNFNINGTNLMAGPNTAEDGYSGDIGNGDHGLTGCFSFNMYGASFGCDSLGPPCDFTFTGYQLNKTSGLDQEVAIQDIAVPACKALTSLKCQLVPVTLDNTFRDLDKVRINVTVAQSPKIWWMDDLRLGWSNNTCEAGLCRISTPIQ